MSQSILYYPNINIEDGAWLRSALLYWDEINTIVPYEEYDGLSADLLFLQQTGQYKPLYPYDVFVLGKPDEFSRMLRRVLGHRHTIFQKEEQRRPLTEKIHSPDLVTLVHYKKIPARDLGLLTDRGVARLHDDGWVEMSPEFARLYMRLLAEFAATYSLEDTIIGTSQVQKINEIYPNTHGHDKNYVISITLEQCLPMPVMDVGLEELLDFKQHHQDDLLALREKIRDLEADISKSEDLVQLKAIMSRFRESWERELLCAEKMFRARKIGFVLGGICSYVAKANAMSSLLQWAIDNGIFNIPKVALGASVGATGLIGVGAYAMRQKEQVHAQRRENGFAYVVSANRAGLIRHKESIEIV